MGTDHDWEPPNPPYKILLPFPVYLFTVEKVSDGKDGLGWKYLGPCKLRATCCGSRAQLRFPNGVSKVVRFGGITNASVIVSAPKAIGDIPIGTEVWLLETEETDYAFLVHGDTTPLPIFSPTTNPIDREVRRALRKKVDSHFELLKNSPKRDLLAEVRSDHPPQLADGSWVVYYLPCGDRVLYFPEVQSYVVESLESVRTEVNEFADVLHHIRV